MCQKNFCNSLTFPYRFYFACITGYFKGEKNKGQNIGSNQYLSIIAAIVMFFR